MEITYENVPMFVKLDDCGNVESVKVGGHDIAHLLTSTTLADIENEYLAAAKIENEQNAISDYALRMAA